MDGAVYKEFAGCRVWQTQTTPQNALSLFFSQNHSSAFPLFTMAVHENSRRLSHDDASEPVTIRFTSKNQQTSVFVHLGSSPSFRERTLHWSPVWCSWVFCPCFQVFPLHPSPLFSERSETLLLQRLPSPSHWIYFITSLHCHSCKPMIVRQGCFVCP